MEQINNINFGDVVLFNPNNKLYLVITEPSTSLTNPSINCITIRLNRILFSGVEKYIKETNLNVKYDTLFKHFNNKHLKDMTHYLTNDIFKELAKQLNKFYFS